MYFYPYIESFPYPRSWNGYRRFDGYFSGYVFALGRIRTGFSLLSGFYTVFPIKSIFIPFCISAATAV